MTALFLSCDCQVMLSSEDLKELGIPMGPRKKIVELIAREKDNVDRIKVGSPGGGLPCT